MIKLTYLEVNNPQYPSTPPNCTSFQGSSKYCEHWPLIMRAHDKTIDANLKEEVSCSICVGLTDESVKENLQVGIRCIRWTVRLIAEVR